MCAAPWPLCQVYDLLRQGTSALSETRGVPSPKEHGAVLQLELDVAMSQRVGSETRCYWVKGGERRVRSTRRSPPLTQ